MKMDKAHRVPCGSSDCAIEILRAREKERAGSAFVFASPPLGRRRTIDDWPLSTMAFLALLKRMQVKAYCATASTSPFKVWAGACAHAEEKTRDRCLAHSTNDPYDQDDRFTQRRPLMQLWADYCAGRKRRQDCRLSEAGMKPIKIEPFRALEYSAMRSCVAYLEHALTECGRLGIDRFAGRPWRKVLNELLDLAIRM